MSLFNYDGSTPDTFKFNTDEYKSVTDFGASFTTSPWSTLPSGDLFKDYLPDGNLFNVWENNTEKVEKKEKKKQSGNATPTAYKNPLRKIANGGVLQYPIDLDTDLQDYFEIQIFNYRPARSLPGIKKTNQGYNKENGKYTDEKESGKEGYGGYFSGSNRRGNRQNFRLQDLQSTIQLPIPPSIKDMNAVDFAGGTMSGLAASVFGPTVNAFLGGDKAKEFQDAADNQQTSALRKFGGSILNALSGTGSLVGGTFSNLLGGVGDKAFRRVTSLNAIAQAVAGLGVQINVDQAITRTSGAVRNPNLELLFKGPTLRNFNFTIRFTPRDAVESKRVRMIIRALKQHSAVKKNPRVFKDATSELGSNFLLGTPDVFKLRYIKARTQKDIKGLNKFKTCALNSISVDYTGEAGRFAAYEEDSQPVTTIIQLSFTELTPIYDADYEEFTTDDDVGL